MAKRNPTPAGTGPAAGSNDGRSKAERRHERAAEASAALAARRRREQIRRVAIIGVIVVAVAAVFTVLVWAGNNKSSSSASGAPPAGQSSYGMAIGNPNAPHQVVIYEDFLCPYCGMFEASSHDGLAAAAAAGKVYVDYRPFHFLQPTYSAQALNAFAAGRASPASTPRRSSTTTSTPTSRRSRGRSRRSPTCRTVPTSSCRRRSSSRSTRRSRR